MYKELSLYDVNLTDKEAQRYLFDAVSHRFNGVVSPVYFLPLIKDVIPEGMVLACPVNYPDGTDDFSILQHSIITAIRKGANSIDLVLNSHHVINNRLDNLLTEIPVYLKICKEHNVTLRVMLEYRLYDSETVLKIVDILVDMNIEYIFPSTGHFSDDIQDNIITCKLISNKYPFLNIISTAQVWTRHQYNMILESKVFGLRFYKTGNFTSIGV